MKRRVGIIAFASLIGVSIFGVTAGTLSWFSNTSVDFGDVSGKINGAYYARGSGAKNDPFVITHPIHLYNLAWLQYMGEYNKDIYTTTDNTVTLGADGKMDQLYFKVEAPTGTLDMTGWTLPPIGTSANPFIGDFDGNDCTISNLTISNVLGNQAGQISKTPNAITSITGVDIIGFFGVVGKLPSTSFSYTYNSAVNQVHDFALNSVGVVSSTSKALAGLAAGYVNADISGITVSGSSSLSFSGQTSINEYSDKLSNYGLVGYTTKMGDSGSYSQEVTGLFNSEDGSGSGDDWGGSIAIDDVYNRLESIRANNANASQTVVIKATDTYNPEGELISSSATTTDNVRSSLGTNFRVMNYNAGSAKTTYNNHHGSFQLGVNSNTADNGIFYLSGGHYGVKQHQAYYQHSGYPIYDGTSYMTVTAKDVDSNKQLITTSNVDNALLFTFDNNGRLTTTYNGTTYYVYRNGNSNTDLRLTSTAGSAITFTKNNADTGTNFRYTYNGTHYLAAVDGRWNLVQIPTLRNEPTEVSEPAVVDKPTEPSEPELSQPPIWRPSSDPGANAHYYYIYNGNNYMSSSGSNIQNTSKGNSNSTNAVWWNFGTTLSGSNYTGTIRNVNTSRYISLSEQSIFGYVWGYNLTGATSTGTYTSWRTSWNSSTKVGTVYQSKASRYLKYSSGWDVDSSNQNNVYLYDVHQAYVDWQAYDANKALWDAYRALDAVYQQYLIDKKAYDDYVVDHAAWERERDAFPGLIAATYQLRPTEYASGVNGPDTYIDNSQTTQGMNYDGNDVTYFPLNVEDDKTPTNKNTGYIVGGSNYTSSSTQYGGGTVRISNFYNYSTDIKNYDTTNKRLYEDSVRTYNDSVDPNGSTVLIDDDNSGFAKYEESKARAEINLAKTAASDKVYGLHFMQNEISKDKCVKAQYAKINVYQYSDYQLPASSIDFNLKERGYVNFFAGTYGRSGSSNATVNSMFSLHMIRRSQDMKTITNIYEIEEVLSDGNQDHSYVYKINGKYTIPYSYNIYNQKVKYVLDDPDKTPLTDLYPEGEYTMQNSIPAGYSTVFKTSWIKYHDYDQHYMYYFEIPINCGEYCLGSVIDNSTEDSIYGAYLVYLDIGAFARDDDLITAYSVITHANSLPYPLGVDFAVLNAAGTGGESLALSVKSAANGILSFVVSENNIQLGDTSSGQDMSTYVYRSDNYSDEQAMGKFTVSGNSPGPLVVPSVGGDRLTHIRIEAIDSSIWNIDMLDSLDSDGTILSTTYPMILQDGVTRAARDIPGSLDECLETIRGLSVAVTLTRYTGTAHFDVTAAFSGEEHKTMALTMDESELNGTKLQVTSIATGYTVSINGHAVSLNAVYPS